jgi:hypothetical protein
MLHEKVGGLALDEGEAGAGGQFGLHGLAIKFAVGLGAGALDGGSLGAVEEAELDAARSATRPMIPSSASTSRTRWPLPRPPMAGLQDITPTEASLSVRSAVLAPARAAAWAASQPAWPPPTTTTSNCFT